MGIWKCKDGHVVIAASRDSDFRALLKILRLWRIVDDWLYTYDRIPDNIKQAMTLYEEIGKETIKYESRELIQRALTYSAKAARSIWRGGGIPIVARVESPSTAMKNEHWHIRRTFVEINDQKLGKFVVPANFVKMSETPPRIKWMSWEIGKDNEYVRKKYLSYSYDEKNK
jgi:crotonobetainyl-CoA:carnitine CoA-transferase CaiB-like acyl-CoA transferase